MIYYKTFNSIKLLDQTTFLHVLKEVAYEISLILTLIFQASLDQGMLPSIWKTAKVVPIFKKGNKSDPCSYRPVSLTCICCKILEHIVYSSISNHFNILCNKLYRFRHNRSCVTQLITTVNDFAKCLNQKGQCDVLMLDFSKALIRFHTPGSISNLNTMVLMDLFYYGLSPF